MVNFLRSLSRRLRRKSSSSPAASTNVATTSRDVSVAKTSSAKAEQPVAVARQPSTVMAAPQSRPFDPRCQCQCKVLLLDGADISIVVGRKALGQKIYDRVYEYLDLYERDYFGLQFTDHYHVHHWLDPLKKVSKQVPIGPPYTFRFHVKFYSSEPSNLREELTRYQFFLQLKADIQTGALSCPKSTAIELAALAMQSEFGDFNAREHTPAFVSQLRFHPLQDAAMECAICEAYGALPRGQSPADAELAYLNQVKWLELYGVDMHTVEGKDGNQYRLGLTPTGMLVFDGEQKIGLFFWEKIQRLDFRNRKLTLVVEEDFEEGTGGQIQLHTFVFELSSHKACKHLWKCAIEHHTFFRLKHHIPPQRATSQLFRLGSTFKYRGRTEYENVHRELIVGDNAAKAASSRSALSHFERRSSQRYVPRQSHLAKQRFRDDVRSRVITCGHDARLSPSQDGTVDPVIAPTHIAETVMRAYCGAKPRVAPLAGISSFEDASSLEDSAPADGAPPAVSVALSRHSSPSGTCSSGIGSSCCMSLSGGTPATVNVCQTAASISTVMMNGGPSDCRRSNAGHVTTIAIEKSNGANTVVTLSDYGSADAKNRAPNGDGTIAGGKGNGNHNVDTNENKQTDFQTPANPNANTDALTNRRTNDSIAQVEQATVKNQQFLQKEELKAVVIIKSQPDEMVDSKTGTNTVTEEVSNRTTRNYDISTAAAIVSEDFEGPSVTITTDNFNDTEAIESLPSSNTTRSPYRSITGAYQHGMSASPTASPCGSKSKIVRFCNMNSSNNSLATNSSDGRTTRTATPRSPTSATRRFGGEVKANESGPDSAIPRPSHHRRCSPANFSARVGPATGLRHGSRIPAAQPQSRPTSNSEATSHRVTTRRSPAPGANRSSIPTLKSNY